MIQEISSKYFSLFEKTPEVKVQAPGRINIIGEHTDYNLGFVLPAAINKYTFFAIGKNGAKTATIYSADYDESRKLDINIPKVKSSGWMKYMESMMIGLQEEGYKIGGFNLVFGGNIPIGAGLSSSAALTCGLYYALSELFDLGISKEKIAKMAQASEHRVGLNCGLMDQYAVTFSKKDHCLFLDCRNLKYKFFPAVLDGYTIVLLDTCITHELTDSGYNDRRNDVESVVELVKKKYPEVQSARDLTKEILGTLSDQIDPIKLKRAHFVINENTRVINTCEALSENDLVSMGKNMNQSHHGLSKMYEVSCKELDFLADFAHKDKNVLGARMMGGGFGGCTINIVKKGYEEEFISKASQAYKTAFNIVLKSYQVDLGKGLGRV
ncbi:galactokinase [Reichenbachiella sp. MALMAid0571]|uniref:galactokinase n=1 Tax=Reichenbachiella sp. MALMAid0571 TaxID=3143939 RepID=UPI0032DEDFE1